MPKYIHKGRTIYRNGTRYDLIEPGYIFICPECEDKPQFVAFDEYGAVTNRNLHFLSSHGDKLLGIVSSDALENVNKYFNEFVERTDPDGPIARRVLQRSVSKPGAKRVVKSPSRN